MIHSIKQNIDIPVQVTSKSEVIAGMGNFIRYQVKDNRIPVGYVDLHDTLNGCYVLYIKNQNPALYKGFGKIADQIEVEHCLNRGIKNPVIKSEAKFNTHIMHFKRGKKFVDKRVNIFLQELLNNLQKGEKVFTNFLGKKEMFMPQELVKKYIEIIKRSPLLK